jgi:hypothetical protein
MKLPSISRLARSACTLLLSVAIPTAGCGGGSSSPSAPSNPTNPNTNPTPPGSNSTISGTVDGAAWSGSAGVSAQLNNNILAVGGTDNRTLFSFAVTINRGVGIYQTGVIDPQNVVTSTLSITGSPGGWTSSATSGRGTVTVSSFTSSTAAGSFSLTLDAVPGTGAAGTKTVNGTFNVTYTNVSAPPGNGRITGTITATVDGAAWRGAVNAFAVTVNGLTTLVGQDTNTREITIVLIGGGVGPHSLTFPTNGSHANIQFGGQVWDTLLPGGTGSVTITSQTPTRVTGTFFFTAQPALGNNGAKSEVTNGTFDLGF